MEFLIIRHANSLNNIGLTRELDSSLSKQGCEEIQRLGKWLSKNFNLTDWMGLTSPYIRCLQTACCLSKHNNILFEVHGGLREYHIEKDQEELKDGGMCIPKREKEFKECGIVWPIQHWNGNHTFYANENFEDFLKRCKLFVNTLQHNGKYVLISHGGTCRVIHHILCGIDLEIVRNRYEGNIEGHFDCSIRNASLTWVKNGHQKWFSRTIDNNYELMCDIDIPGLDQPNRSKSTSADS